MDLRVRLILSPKNNAKTNMQIDKTLLEMFKIDDLPILRLYTWEDSFSVGVSQKCEDFPLHVKAYKNNCAKRITGGGVLFHGFDISYSLIIQDTKFKHLSIKQSYEKISIFLLNFYKNLGLNPNFAKDLDEINLSKNEFCQVGFEAYDIIINGKKIGGNAQKRLKNIIFQHGSIPIKQTKDKKLQGFSLEDLGLHVNVEDAKRGLLDSFKESFGIKFINSDLNEKEMIMLEKNLKKII